MAFKFYTCEEVAERCHVTIETVWKWIRGGKLDACDRPGTQGSYLVRDDKLTEFQEKHFPQKNNENREPT